jgi:hypothetical protein
MYNALPMRSVQGFGDVMKALEETFKKKLIELI